MELRVKDAGGSEGHSVIEWIGIISYAKAGRLPAGLSSRESLINRHKIGRQTAVMKQFAQAIPTEMSKSSTDAPTHTTNGWHDIDWYDITRNVSRQQARIVKAANRIETVSVIGH